MGDKFAVEDALDALANPKKGGMADWRWSILERVGEHEWSLWDAMTGETLLASQVHNGAHGVLAKWGKVFRLPESESIEAHKKAWGALSGADEHAASRVDESPKRKRARANAAQAQAKQGEEMKKRAAHASGGAELDVGAIVQVAAANVDRAKVDPVNATLVIVEKIKTGTKQPEIKCQHHNQTAKAILPPGCLGENY